MAGPRRPDRVQAYLAAAVAALDAAPDAVLCNTAVDYIDERGQVFANYTSVLGDAGGARPSERFATMVLRSHSCVDMFGLIRRRALERSLLISRFHGADRALLAQLALRGRLLQLPERLVEMREHGNRYTRQISNRDARRLWHSSSAKRSSALPTLNLYRVYLGLVAQRGPDDSRTLRVLRGARPLVVHELELRPGCDGRARPRPARHPRRTPSA